MTRDERVKAMWARIFAVGRIAELRRAYLVLADGTCEGVEGILWRLACRAIREVHRYGREFPHGEPLGPDDRNVIWAVEAESALLRYFPRAVLEAI